MKKIYILLLLECITCQAMAKIKISGEIISESNEPITYTVVMQQIKTDGLVTATFHQTEFNLLAELKGKILLTISAEGYETYQTILKSQPKEQSIGKITLLHKKNKHIIHQTCKDKIDRYSTN